jgi:predicted DNA-binding ribbon-helix-helix protein
MTQRLQVLLEDAEFDELRRAARNEGIPVSELVRRALREARDRRPAGDLDTKLRAVRAAIRHEFPTADIDDMLEQTERGYRAPTA